MDKNLENIFTDVIPHHNLLTSVIIDYVKVGRHICELSRNTGNSTWLFGNLYGVTVISKVKGEYVRNISLDASFDNIQDADNYINNLNGK